VEVTDVAIEENGFLEYLQLQDGVPDLVTKSELITRVRESGYSLSDRQLTFYVTEGLIPRSVRVGSRAGAYPAIVVELMEWVLHAREEGASIEALRELLPVWKFLVRARIAHELNLGELEYIARQHVSSVEGSISVPRVVSDVMMRHICPDCRGEVTVIYKDGSRKPMSDATATVGFAIVRTPAEGTEVDNTPQWYASTRLSLAHPRNYSTDPTTVILGVKPNAALPADPGESVHDASPQQRGAARI
jgi:DNA-binding transcriptional MerR regulator